MIIATTFDTGDTGFAINHEDGTMRRVTIGSIIVRVEGEGPGETQAEEYMALETGVGNGILYTLGRDIFASEHEWREAAGE